MLYRSDVSRPLGRHRSRASVRGLLRPLIVAWPAAGLVIGLAAQFSGGAHWASPIWAAATIPVLLALVAAAHIGEAQCAHPENCAARPMTRPAAGHATISGRSKPRTLALDRCRPNGRDTSDRFSMHLRRLNGPQIEQECTRVFARETKRWHIRMANPRTVARMAASRMFQAMSRRPEWPSLTCINFAVSNQLHHVASAASVSHC